MLFYSPRVIETILPIINHEILSLEFLENIEENILAEIGFSIQATQ